MFIAYVKQIYEGCDFTIGCAQTLWRLSAKTKDEAIAEVKKKTIGDYVPGHGYEEGYWIERELGEVTLFEVLEDTKLPIKQWYTEARKFLEEQKNKERTDLERAEFERLKAKFG